MGVYGASDGSESKETADKCCSENSEGSETKEGGHDNGPKGSDGSEGRETLTYRENINFKGGPCIF